jgi:hypothetical protein
MTRLGGDHCHWFRKSLSSAQRSAPSAVKYRPSQWYACVKTGGIVFAQDRGSCNGPSRWPIRCFLSQSSKLFRREDKEGWNIQQGTRARRTTHVSTTGSQTDATVVDPTSPHKAPRPAGKHKANEFHSSTRGCSLEPAIWVSALHCPKLRPCHCLCGLLGKTPLKARRRHPQTPRVNKSPRVTWNSTMPRVERCMPRLQPGEFLQNV